MKSTPAKGSGKRKERRYGDGRAAFLGHVEAIQKWVDEGRTLRSYYDDHEAALGITYSTFIRHARSFLRPLTRSTPNGTSATQPAAVQGPAKANSAPSPARPTGPAVGAPQFKHSPDSGNNQDDLI